jgi:hypothetical protein
MELAHSSEQKKCIRILVGKRLAMRLHKYGCQLDETGSGSFPMASY